MKTIINFYFFLLISIVSFSQEKFKEIHLKVYHKSNLFQILEENNKGVSIFFDEYTENEDPNDDQVKAIRFNENLEVIDSLLAPRPTFNKLQKLVGYEKNEQVYYTYWQDSESPNMFIYQSYDFSKREVNQGNIGVNFVGVDIIKKITINNIFYIIALDKKADVLYFYKFNGISYKRNPIDLAQYSFLGDGPEVKATNFKDVLDSSLNSQMRNSIQEISNESPSSLVNTCYTRKFYKLKDNQLLFTFDNNTNVTQGFTVNLNTFETKFIKIDKPNFEKNDNCSSNSFYINDNLIQIKNNSDKFMLSIKDMNGTEIKSYEALKDTEIEFKNSEIIQENGSVASTRVLEKTNQFIRKINNLYSSVTCYKNGDTLNLTIGGVSNVQDNSAMLYGGMFGLAGVLIGAAIDGFNNSSLNNINSYQGRKIVYVNCVFDKNFNSVKQNSTKLAFDKLRIFLEKNPNLLLQTAFKLNNDLILGSYNKKSKVYSFYKFQD